jgi:hypothetical protein
LTDSPLPFLTPRHASSAIIQPSLQPSQASTSTSASPATSSSQQESSSTTDDAQKLDNKTKDKEQHERDMINDNHRLSPLFGCWHASYLANIPPGIFKR